MHEPTPSIDDGHRHVHVRPAAVTRGLTRRRLLTGSAAFDGAGLNAAVMPADRPTAEQVVGPFDVRGKASRLVKQM